MTSQTPQQLAMTIARLNEIFMNNYMHALQQARIEASDVSELDEEALARILRTASQQNAEMAEYFAAELQVEGEPQWNEAVQRWKGSLLDLAEYMGDERPGAMEKIAKFLALGTEGAEAVVHMTHAGNVGHVVSHTTLGALAPGVFAQSMNALVFLQAWKDGDWGKMAGVTAGALVIAGLTYLATAAAASVFAITLPVAILIGVAIAAFGYATTVGATTTINERLGITEGELDLQYLQRFVGDPRFQMEPTSGHRLQFGESTDDVLTGVVDVRNAISGSGGADIIHGGDLSDFLSGGNGADMLNGGAGSDLMKGGEGFDTYRFVTDDLVGESTHDVIVDSDGQGVILFNGLNIAGTGTDLDKIRHASLGAYETPDGQFRITLVNAGQPDQALIFLHRATHSTITIRNWQNGDLGINLPAQPETTDPTAVTHAGGLNADYLNPNVDTPLPADGIHAEGDRGRDMIYGANGARDDELNGGDGDDIIVGNGGTDRIDGGRDNDFLSGFGDDSIVHGGDGNDVIAADYEYGFDFHIDSSLPIDEGTVWRDLQEYFNWQNSTGFTAGENGNLDVRPVFDLSENFDFSGVSSYEGWTYRFWKDVDGNYRLMYFSPEKPQGFYLGGDGIIRFRDDAATFERGVSLYGDAGSDDIRGGNASDFIDGGADADRIAAGGGNDVVVGGTGDDEIAAGDGDDVIDGGAGADTVYGERGGDTINGGAGDDRIWGDMHSSVSGVEGGADVIDGGAGDDQIVGQGGNDVLAGGDGNDTLFGDEGDDRLLGGGGADQLQGGAGNDGLFGGDGDDRLVGEAGDDLLDGENGNDQLSGGDGDDNLAGGSGNDELSGGTGSDTLLGEDGLDTLQGGEGNDLLDGGGNADRLYGEAGDDRLQGGLDTDALYGGDGNDTLDGGDQNDELWGDAGNDRLLGGAGADQLAGGAGNDELDGGAGVDRLFGQAGNDRLRGGAGDDYLDGDETTVAAAEHGSDDIDGGDGADLIHGQGGDDIVRGGAGDDRVFGDDFEHVFSGNDTVEGGAGNDYVDGGAGNDVLNGGSGDDVLLGGQGDDRYHFESGWGVDSILRLDSANAGADSISFGSGIALADLTFEVRGQDLLITRTGQSDSIYVQGYFAHGLAIALQFDGGATATRDQIALALGIGATTGGTAGADTLLGTEGDDRLYGGQGDDTVNGLAGNDYLNGGDGNDTLIGGIGDDNLEGGAGNDVYLFELGSGVDRVIGLDAEDAGDDVIRFGAGLTREMILSMQISGNDLMIAFRNGGGAGAGLGETVMLQGFLSPDNRGHVIEFADGTRMTASDFSAGPSDWTGTDADETYYGSSGTNRLEGRGGVDRLFGLDGADTLDGGDGDDMLDGGAGDDQLWGGRGADTIDGGDGNDVLRGDESYESQAADTLRGGAGNDTYFVGTAYQYATTLDTVVERAGEGIDTVQVASYSYRLTDNVENLVALYRSDYYYWQNPSYPGWHVDIPRVLQGNDLDNRIEFAPLWMGQSHAGRYYVLDGGAGADTLIGTEGNDTYVVDQAGDVIVEPTQSPFMQESIDTVRASYSYSLAWNEYLENVELVGTQDLSAWGNARDNRLDGSRSEGVNTLSGGSGNDTYAITAEDQVVELDGEGNDTVVIERLDETSASGDWFDLADYANVENLRLGNNLSIDLSYSGSSNLGAFHANLRGNAGDNRLTGNGFANEIRGGDGNDTIEGGEREPNSSYAAARDTLYGEGGNDVLRAGSGGAMLDGGSGNDELYGRAGKDDDFHYAAGGGADLVDALSWSGSDTDRVIFAADITPDMLSWSRSGNDLLIQVGTDAANTLTVRNYWIESGETTVLSGAIDQFVFADGTIRRGDLNELPYSNAPPVVHVSSLQVDVADETAFDYALPDGAFSDPDGDALVYSFGSGAPGWLSIDPASGRVSGTAPDGSARYYVDVIATDIRGRSVSTILTIDVRNVVRGTAGNDTLLGDAGSDELQGYAGNDRLVANGGADRLVGGLGDDTYVVDDGAQSVVELAGEGNDTVESSVQSFALSDNVENMTLLEGSDAFEAIGNGLANRLTGNSGDNRLDGGAGADLLQGGAGDDYYVVDAAGDQVVEAANAGNDTVESTLSWQLGTAVENLLLVGQANIDGTGNALANEIEGNDGNNRLDGAAGADRLRGGLGDDYYVVDVAQDQVFEQADGGTDTLERRYETNLVLSTQIENLVLGSGVITGNGNNRDNVVTGNAANNKLMGLDGNDYLSGLGGNDSIWAGAGNDTLLGGIGNDYLDGGAGNDRFEGGAGDDVFVMAGDGSDVVDTTGGGSDRILFTSGVTRARLAFLRDGNDLLILIDGAFPPAARVSNHFLGGDAAIDFVQADGGTVLTAAQINQLVASGSGSPFDQMLTGTGNGERIDGAAGRDLIRGLGGNDTLIGGGGDDTLQGGDGNDILNGGFDGMAGGGQSTPSGADRLEGGTGDDSLRGGDGRNTLIGGSGSDTYYCGSGEDTIDNSGGGVDSVTLAGAVRADLAFTRSGDDLVVSFVSDASRSFRVLNHFLGGDAALDFVDLSSGSLDTAAINALVDAGSGNGDYPSVVTGTSDGEQLAGTDERDLIKGLAGDDELFGFAGDDKLDGGDGDDYLSGGNGSGAGSGNDILIGGAGSDTFYGEDGDDAMFGGSGNDYYAFGGGVDTIDNSGGGTDWLLFNSSGSPINRNRLSFHRDGNDLIVRVDGDSSQQVRVIKHFLGGDYALDYVQPGDGNAIPASQFGALLTANATSVQAVDGLISAMAAFTTSREAAADMSFAAQGQARHAMQLVMPH